MGCRNWRAGAQDRGRWRHLLEEAKAPSQGCRADDDDDDDDCEEREKTNKMQQSDVYYQ